MQQQSAFKAQGRNGKPSKKIFPKQKANQQKSVQQSAQPKRRKFPVGKGRSPYAGPTIGAPVAMSTLRKMDSRRGKKSDRLTGCDLIGTINDAASFTVSKYAVNPGIASTFPWLAVEAAQWNEYRLHKCKFLFVTRSATSQVGTIIMAPNYDASDSAPTLESQLGNFSDSVEDTEWKDIECTLDLASMHPIGPRKFVRTAAVAGDIKTYDVANFFLSVDGATTNVIGKLYVEYDVEFFDRIVVPAASAGEITTFGSGAGAIAPGGTLIDYSVLSCNALGATASGGNSFVLPAGAYVIRTNTCIQDNVSEQCSLQIQIQKNSNAVETAISTSPLVLAQTAGAYYESLSVPCSAYIVSNGTDIITVVSTITNTGTTACFLKSATIEINVA
jgi:hypothetical protein